MKKLEYLKQMSVLVADDDEVVLKSFVNVLNIFVKEVKVARDGKEALKIYKNEHVDILILDIEMPFINGLEVAKEIRKSDIKTPIFIATSFNDTTHLHKAMPLMLTEYLVKPVSFDQLQNALLNSVGYLDKHESLTIKIDEKTMYNKTTGELTFANEETVSLPKNEKILLDILLENKNQTISKEYLENEVFGFECGNSSLKNLVYRLKKRFDSQTIVNEKDLGYKIVTHV